MTCLEERETLFYICCINARDRLSRRPSLPLSRHCHVSRNITRDILIDSHHTAQCIWLRNSLSSPSLRYQLAELASPSRPSFICVTPLLTPDSRQTPANSASSSQASRQFGPGWCLVFIASFYVFALSLWFPFSMIQSFNHESGNFISTSFKGAVQHPTKIVIYRD